MTCIFINGTSSYLYKYIKKRAKTRNGDMYNKKIKKLHSIGFDLETSSTYT